ncbi:hypothetical protein BC828DRAFT_374322 [Blastocladiella britannica]|nr:hypothetical protein BC828DRAFT_374322 [Blastocladiella britannica]
MWATTFINVRKLTARNWALISLPYLATLLLHLLVMVLTAISRAGSPIEFVVELGQFAFAVDWYIFINKTEPLLRDVQATEVDVSVMSSQSGGSGGGNRSRQGSRARPVIVTKGRNPPKREVIYQKKSLPPTPLSPTSLTSGNGMPLSSASSGGAAAAARAMAAHEDILGTAVLPTTMMPASQMMGMSPPSQPLSPALSQPAGVYFARPATPGTTPGTTPQGLYASHKHMLGAGLSISPNSGKSFMTAHTSSGGGSRGSASMSRQGTDSSTRGSMAPEVSEQYELSNYYSMDRKEPSPPQQQQQQQPQKQQHQRQLSSSSFTKPATSPLPIAAGSDPAWRFLSSLQSSQQLLASEDDAGQYHAGLALGDDGATSVAGVSGSTVMGPLSRESMMGRRSVPLATPEPAAVAAVATATAAVPAGAAVPPTYDSFEVEEYIELSDTAGSRERPSRRSTSDFTVHAYSTMPATVSTVSSPPLPRDAAAAAADVLLRASGTQPLSPQRQAYVQLQQQQHQQPAALFPLPQQLPAPPEYQAAEDRWRRARAEWEANTAAGDAAESGQLARPPHTMALGRAAAEGDTVLVLDDGDVPLRSPSGVPLAPFEVAEERWRRERAEWDRKQLEAVRAEAQNARRGIP